MLPEVVNDRVALRALDPVVPRHQAVVLIRLPVPTAPVVELASSHAGPLDDPLDGNLRLLGDAGDEVDDLVT